MSIKIQKMINMIDQEVSKRPVILSKFKQARLEGDLDTVNKLIEDLKRIQDLETRKPILLERLEESVSRFGKKLEFGGFTISEDY